MNDDGFVEPGPSVTFADELDRLPFDRLLDLASSATAGRVDRAVERPARSRTLDDLAAMLSPEGATRLETMAAASRDLTIRRFGPTMRMFSPLYLSNECLSTCTYCGFAKGLPIRRRTLSVDETLAEARHLLRAGFRSLLLLTGEHERDTGLAFLQERIRALAAEVPQLAVEVQVWSELGYQGLVEAGCEGLVIFQETYHPLTYTRVHTGGRKRDYRWRLLGPERGARAGMRRLGLGALLGLHHDWRYEVIAVAAHARFLMKHYWRSQVSVSIPRIRPSASGYEASASAAPDARGLAQLVCALRLMLPDIGIVLSTRESPALRDGLARIGVTHMSAGSRTEPGGYEQPDEAAEQFEVADLRDPAEVAERLRVLGYDPVWEEWARVTPAVERRLAPR